MNQSNIIHGLFRPSPLAKVLAAFGAWHSRRAAIRELRAMPDALLRDIGIERNQIKDAVYNRVTRPAIYTLRADSESVAPQAAPVQKAA